jgi:hypothetical protein
MACAWAGIAMTWPFWLLLWLQTKVTGPSGQEETKVVYQYQLKFKTHKLFKRDIPAEITSLLSIKLLFAFNVPH